MVLDRQALIEHERHGEVSNHLYGDWHVEAQRFEKTIGQNRGDDHCNETNQHYLLEFTPPLPALPMP